MKEDGHIIASESVDQAMKGVRCTTGRWQNDFVRLQ